MIKLVATDCDGTLMPESTMDLDPAYYEEIRRLHEKGIVVAAISGREYKSLEMLMEPVKDIAILISDNGGVLTLDGEEIFSSRLEPDMVRDAILFARSLPEVDYYFTSTDAGAATDSKNLEMIRQLESGYNEKILRVDDLLLMPEVPTKVALHTPGDSKYIADLARERFAGRVSVVESGMHWMDFVPNGVSKGGSIRYLRERFGIERDEVMVFGDNVNDISMFEEAGHSYAVAEARDEVKAAAMHLIGSYRDLSVLQVLRSL